MQLKIALFTYSTKPRGSVIHTLELAEALHQLGHRVCVYALDPDNTGFDFLLSCDYQPIPARLAPKEIDALVRQRIGEFVDYLSQSNLNADCYHAQDCLSANALAILLQQQRIPHFIRTVHHIENYNSPSLQECQERSIREATLCLCVSQYWQSELRTQFRIEASRVVNGINLQRFSPIRNGLESVLRQRMGLKGWPIYLTVGGIEPRKNSLRLLQAFAQVLKHYPTAQLVIAGGATLFDYQAYRDEFFELVAQLGIEIGCSLILPGVLSGQELPALYRLATAFVFPSIQEGWGLVVLEAIACGLPVITSDHPPFTEFLSHKTAILVNPESVEAIASALHLVLQPELAMSLVQQSQSILPSYTWKNSAKLHLQYYQSLLECIERDGV
jgi:glycosyltransferase-like protein